MCCTTGSLYIYIGEFVTLFLVVGDLVDVVVAVCVVVVVVVVAVVPVVVVVFAEG